MPTLDWIKLAFILPVFFGGGPLLGTLVKGDRKKQRFLFGLMCFMTINGLLDAGNWGLTLDSVEHYRGHAKGYHFYFNHIIAIALLTARWLEDRKSFRWVPPGMLIYGLFIAISSLSIVNAPRVDYALMAIHKMSFFALMGLAAFNCLRTVDDLRFFTVVMGGTMMWEGFVVLKLKYLQGQYQVHGTFEHQNSLAMYTILISMPLLAVGLGPKFKGQGLCVGGFLLSAVIIQGALSRASLVMFALGMAGIGTLSLLEKPTARRFTVLTLMALIGGLGLTFTLDTIINRFNDKGNVESAELREVLNEAARQMEAAHPLGIGWNNYAHVINAPFPYAEVVYDWIRGRNMRVMEDLPNAPVESHYYLLFSENGYPGLIAWYFVMAAGIFRNLLGFIRFRHSFERCLCLGILTGTSLNYIQSTLERTLTQPRNLMLWLLLYGITGRLAVLRRNRGKGLPDEGAGAGPEPAAAPAPAAVPGAGSPSAGLPAGRPALVLAPAAAPSAGPRPGKAAAGPAAPAGGTGRWPSPAGWRAALALSSASGGGTGGGAAGTAVPALPGFPEHRPPEADRPQP